MQAEKGQPFDPTRVNSLLPSFESSWAGSAAPTRVHCLLVSFASSWAGSADPTRVHRVLPSFASRWAGSADPTRVTWVLPSFSSRWAGSANPTRVNCLLPSFESSWAASGPPRTLRSFRAGTVRQPREKTENGQPAHWSTNAETPDPPGTDTWRPETWRHVARSHPYLVLEQDASRVQRESPDLNSQGSSNPWAGSADPTRVNCTNTQLLTY